MERVSRWVRALSAMWLQWGTYTLAGRYISFVCVANCMRPGDPTQSCG